MSVIERSQKTHYIACGVAWLQIGKHAHFKHTDPFSPSVKIATVGMGVTEPYHGGMYKMTEGCTKYLLLERHATNVFSITVKSGQQYVKYEFTMVKKTTWNHHLSFTLQPFGHVIKLSYTETISN